MSHDTLLTHRATHRRPSETNTNGLITVTFTDLATNIPCLIQEQLGQIQSGPSGTWLQYQAIGFFQNGLDLRPTGAGSESKPDQIVANGITYTVLHVGDESGRNHHQTALLRRERSVA